MPKVSIITPAYNHVKFIRQCVESALSQTYEDRELIVVDDGSTDGTAEVLQGYGDRLTYIRQENRGTQAALNRGIRVASGEFIGILDSDDAWLANKLERQIQVFAEFQDVALVYSLVYLMDSEGRFLQNAQAVGRAVANPRNAFEELVLGNVIPTVAAVFRRTCLDEVGLFDESLPATADWDFWLRIAGRWPIACVNEPLAVHRLHQSNTWDALIASGRAFQDTLTVIERAFAAFPEREVASPGLRGQALARAHLLGAKVAAIRGDTAEIRREVGEALLLDPGLWVRRDLVVETLAQCVNVICADRRTARKYREATHELFSQFPQTADVMRAKRSVLATSAMSTVFRCYTEEDLATVRALLPAGIVAAPAWLLNRGVWSIGVEAFLGQRVAAWLRKLI